MKRISIRLAAAAAAVLFGLTALPQEEGLRNLLWAVVNQLCVPNELQKHDPAPCLQVEIGQGVDHGFALVPDILGARQILLVPTARISGIESAALLNPGASNYFADAWQSRASLDRLLKVSLPREDVALAVNSIAARTQDQLHIHLECLQPRVQKALRTQLAAMGGQWAPLKTLFFGHRYQAMWVAGEQLSSNPFQLLARDLPGAAQDMGDRTLVVAGATRQGQPGFVILEDRAAGADRAHGEELLDPGCQVAGAQQ